MSCNDLYNKALSQFLPSEDMRTHLEANRISSTQIISLILESPVSLYAKREFFAEAFENCPEEWATVRDQIRTHYEALNTALIELEQIKDNEFLYRKTIWDEQPILDEWHEAGIAPFSSIESLLDNLREEMIEEEWDDDSGCWNVVEKWRRNDDATWTNTYRFYFIREEAVFFDRPESEQGYAGRPRYSRIYCGSPHGLDLPTPFEAGDIITLDCRPFMPLKYGLVLEREDNIHRSSIFPQILTSRDAGPFSGTWDENALKIGSGFQICPPGYSLLYKATCFREKLPEEYALLGKLQEIIQRDRNLAVVIARATDTPISNEELNALAQKLEQTKAH